MRSEWTSEEQTISTLRNWVIVFVGALIVVSIFFLQYFYGVEERSATGDSSPHKQEKSIAAKIVDDPVALFTLVLSVFTGGLFWATFLLWGATKRLVIGADNTAERQLRAYVHVVGVKIFDFEVGKTPLVKGEFKNFGQTPAYKCRSWINITGYKQGMEAASPIDKLEDTWTSEQTLGPSVTQYINIPWGQEMTTDIHDDLVKNGLVFVALGEIAYVDAFSRSRYAKFRYVFGGDYGMPREESIFMAPTGNEAT